MHRFSKMPDRIVVRGEPVGVFGLLLHEMMTNAAKYGSLSVPSGKLKISWQLAGNGDCCIDWRESGGPEVSIPTRKGFGSSLIEKTVLHDLGGDLNLEFAAPGLNANFVLPARHLHTIKTPVSSLTSAISQEDDRPIDGLRVLLVEDQSLIAMDTEELLRSLGALEVSVAATIDTALLLTDNKLPVCAVLDLNLGETASEDTAAELNRLSVPYVFATGYRDGISIPDGYSNIPVVRKPVAPAALAIALADALNVGSGRHDD